jgi:hypothetical protein
MSVYRPETRANGMTMDDMTSPAHAKHAPKDYLWVLAVIAACALIKVSPSWVGIAAAAGFPRFGRMPTDWTLAVIMEAYWGYALYAWLAAASGVRSRRFAMWSAAGVFTLSLAGQSAARLVGAKVMTGFANGMPVIVLALIAILVHLRQLDRAEAVQAEEAARKAERARAEAAAADDERTALRAQLEDARAAVDPLRADLETARSELARVTAKAGAATAKLEAQRKRNSPAKRRATSPRNRSEISRATKVPDDVGARAEALGILASEPDISGADLGLRVGKSKRWGQLFLRGLATAPKGPDAEEDGS